MIDDAFSGRVHDEEMMSDHTVSCICDIFLTLFHILRKAVRLLIISMIRIKILTY